MLKFTLFVTFGILLSATNSEIVIPGHFDKNYEEVVNDLNTITISYTYIQESHNQLMPPRLVVELSDDFPNRIDKHDSLIVFVRHRGGAKNWHLPSITKHGKKPLKIAHTLWAPLNNTNNYINTSKIIVNFSTSSKTPVKFTTSLKRVENFSVPLKYTQKFNVSLLQPVIYYFKFEKVDMVLIQVKSEDYICMTLSIQNSTNAVFDRVNTIKYQGLRQTVTKNGGIIVSKDEYPFGLLLVFVVHSTNESCTKTISSLNIGEDIHEKQQGKKHIELYIKPTVNFNLQMMSWLLIIVLCVWLLLFFTLFYRQRNKILMFEPNKQDTTKSATSYGSTVGSTAVNVENDNESNISSFEQEDNHKMKSQENNKNKKLYKEFERIKTLLFLSDLSTKNHNYSNSQSKLYLWNLLTVATFYALPVIQLVFTLQMVLNDHGNQDTCYYNFFCSHGLTIGDFKFSDFNHIFSNIGYVFFGLLFIIITYKRERAFVPKENFGTPRHSGLYYSMGSALAFEGLMSACYHVCPNHMNFQFDTSFMYIISMLCIVKIYQTRHPDINANSYFVFGLLAFVIILGLSGIITDNGLAFNVFFTFIHLTMCFWLSTYIYYMGTWKLDKKMLSQFYEYLMSKQNPYIPKYKDRMVLLAIGLLINFGLALSHVVQPEVYGDFPNYLLTLFMVNLILYLLFYIVMKLITKEHIYFGSCLYIIIAMIFWCAALYFFNWRTSSWEVTAAESRELNHKCIFWELFDSHDIWHFLSSISLFFSFMVLITLDDDLVNRPTSTIPVF